MAKDKKKTVGEEKAETNEKTVAAENAGEETVEAKDERDSIIEELNAKLLDANDKLLRTVAEYDNFRKRSQKEKEASYGNGKADAVAKMLPIYDNLERALNQPTEDEAFKKGVEMTMTQLVGIFSGLGVEIFGNVGEEFDPNFHNAVMQVQSEEYEAGIVAQELQKGYTYRDNVVRYSMVAVVSE